MALKLKLKKNSTTRLFMEWYFCCNTQSLNYSHTQIDLLVNDLMNLNLSEFLNPCFINSLLLRKVGIRILRHLGKRTPPNFTFAFQTLRKRLNQPSLGQTSSRLSSASLSNNYSQIAREAMMDQRWEMGSTSSKISYPSHKGSAGGNEQLPAAVAVSHPNLKFQNLNSSTKLRSLDGRQNGKNSSDSFSHHPSGQLHKLSIKESAMNNSTELPHSLSANYNNMDVIVESDAMEDRTDRYDTPDSTMMGT